MKSNLKAILEQIRSESGSPAAAGIIVNQNETIALEVVGLRLAGDMTPVTISDRFHIGSNTKAWTATVGANLVNEGVISWDALPVEVLDQPVLAEYEEITLEMLLRHEAGIPPYTEEEHYENLPEFDGSPTDQRIEFSKWLLSNEKPVNKPGSEMSYSNAGYGIAAALMEKAAGRTWEAMILEDICEPLGIGVGFGWPILSGSDQPTGHSYGAGGAKPHGPDDEFDLPAIIAPAGDLSCSMPDYGQFLQENLKALHGGQTKLPRKLMMHLHNDGKPGVGMGWGVQPAGDAGLSSAHVGGAGTFTCIVAVSHAQDLAVALAVNAGSEKDDSFEGALRTGFKAIIHEYAIA